MAWGLFVLRSWLTPGRPGADGGDRGPHGTVMAVHSLEGCIDMNDINLVVILLDKLGDVAVVGGRGMLKNLLICW